MRRVFIVRGAERREPPIVIFIVRGAKRRELPTADVTPYVVVLTAFEQ
jgi:hypothetical protein